MKATVIRTHPVLGGYEFPSAIHAPGTGIGDIVRVRTHGRLFDAEVVQTTGEGEGNRAVRAVPVSKAIRKRFARVSERETATVVRDAERGEARIKREGGTMFDGLFSHI